VVAAPAKRYAPSDRPRVAVASDGSLAAIQERTRIVVTELPSCAELSELGIDGDAIDIGHAWVGTPPRLVVLSRYESRCTIHLVDPFGPRAIAELQLESPLRLCAAVGNHALAIGAQGAVVLAATEHGLTPHAFPARAIPAAAGAAGTQFVVALPGAIEEWDPHSRMPKRRLKLARPAQVTALGGSDRVVWMTTQQEPTRIDVIPLVARGQPKSHELPEPIAHVASHPRSDLIVCIGATSGRVWVIDLDGRIGLRMVGPEGIERVEAAGLVLGRIAGVLAAQTKRPLAVVALEHHDDDPPAPVPRARGEDSAKRSSLYEETHGAHEPNTAVTLHASEPVAAPASVAKPPSPPVSASAAPPPPKQTAPRTKPAPPPAQPPTATPLLSPAKPVLSRFDNPAFANFRDRVAHPRARTVGPDESLWPEAAASWRDDLLEWVRHAATAAPGSIPIDALVARYELDASLAPVLALLYGAHLLGETGVAPVDVARHVGWPEALGRGELAAKAIATFVGSRIQLATVLRRALDEQPPETGTLVGTPGLVSLLGPCTIVAAGPLAIIAEACVSSIGSAILAAHDGVEPAELVAEARAYGAAPMLRVTSASLAQVPVDQPLILVVDNDHTADQLGLPRLQ
jgi:hypothetical protein